MSAPWAETPVAEPLKANESVCSDCFLVIPLVGVCECRA